MIFEAEDLEEASPATVSRCGMVYMEPTTLGVEVLFHSWKDRLQDNVNREIMLKKMDYLYDFFVEDGCEFLRL